MRPTSLLALAVLFASTSPLLAESPTVEALDKANPVAPLSGKLLGHDTALADLTANKPDPEKVRLGRWLFYDKRLSADGTIACATCHNPDHAFSELTPVSTGIKGQKGGRKAPSFVNAVFAFTPDTFWDGRAKSLEDQAKGPMINPIEMGTTHEAVEKTVAGLPGYVHFFKKAFGDEKVTIDRVAEAIAHYERTCISGNSPYDKWKAAGGKADDTSVSDEVKQGDALFFGKALCSRCHVGNSFTDSRFHNLGIGWDEKTKTFKDKGRSEISKNEADTGAFKTPGLREVSHHAPYMHDGSLATLEDVMAHYVKGGTPNPHLSEKMEKIDLTPAEVKAVIAMMKALDGEGYKDKAPSIFP